MVLNIKELSTAMSALSDFTSGDKNANHVMLSITDTDVRLCYTDGVKKFSYAIGAVIDASDVKGKLIFDFAAFARVVDACKPSGKIITDNIEFKFGDNNIVEVTAEKFIRQYITDSSGEVVDEKRQLISRVNQSLTWTHTKETIKLAVFDREDFNFIMHSLTTAQRNEMYSDSAGNLMEVHPLSLEEWHQTKSEWNVDELRNSLAKLSTESGKLVYISPKMRGGFVVNTSHIIFVPIVESDYTMLFIQSTSMSKAIASILGKLGEDTVYTTLVGGNNIVFSTEDDKCAFSIRVLKQSNNDVLALNNKLETDYSHYMFNFNREVLQNIVGGAKSANASDKAHVSFKQDDDGVSMCISAKNTNASTSNRYDVLCERSVLTDSIDGLEFDVHLDTLSQALSRSASDYIALDIHRGEGSTSLRISAIDMAKVGQISEEYGLSGGWSDEFTIEHRRDMLGIMTFFSA